MEKSSYLTKRTLHHPPPRMKKTLAKLAGHFVEEGIYTYRNSTAAPAKPPRNAFADGLAQELEKRPKEDGGEDDEGSQPDHDQEVECGDVGVDEL